jgi:hypothetical protein
VRETESLRAELAGMYYRAMQAPARCWLPVPVHALFEQATVTRMPGLTLVYGPGAPGHGNLLMSHSDVGAGADQFGNQYHDGDTAYRDAFTRATPRGQLGLHIPDTYSSTAPALERNAAPGDQDHLA